MKTRHASLQDDPFQCTRLDCCGFQGEPRGTHSAAGRGEKAAASEWDELFATRIWLSSVQKFAQAAQLIQLPH
jgi:hypothetical protein